MADDVGRCVVCMIESAEAGVEHMLESEATARWDGEE